MNTEMTSIDVGKSPGAQSKEVIDSVLKPASVVVIGASPHGRGFTSAPLRNLRRHHFRGTVFAVNPRYTDVDGIACFPDVQSLPEVPDTAVIVVGAKRVPDALAECAAVGVKSATVVASGFAELGAEGQRLESRIQRIVDESNIRLVGPNTAGLMNFADNYVPRAGLNHPDDPKIGAIAVATQSGALCNTVVNRVLSRGLGISYSVATGSQWDLDLWDFVDYFATEDRVKAILTVAEGLKDGEKFLVTARRAAALGKPIILLKPGRSELGKHAVQTHSGALAGSVDVQLSLMRENGVIVVDELDQLWEVGQLFEAWRPQHITGRPWNLGISTLSGGDGALAADMAEAAGLRCPPPSAQTVEQISSTFTLASATNPFDYTGAVVAKPELIGPATSALIADPAFDAFLIATPVWSANLAEWTLGPAFDAAVALPERNVAVSVWSAGAVTEVAEKLARDRGLPLFDGSPRAVAAIGRYAAFMSRVGERPDALAPKHAPAAPEPATRVVQDYWSSREILLKAGVPFNEARLVSTADEAVAAARSLGLPVTLKLTSHDVVHKVAAGAVRLHLREVSEVHTAAEEMLHAMPGARLVVESYAPGVSMALVGGQRDSEFGPVIVVGLGGGYAEAYHDVAHVRCPATGDEAHRALLSTVFGRMLGEGSRGFDSLVRVIERTSNWFANTPQVAGFDVNPVLIDLDGNTVAVDARVEIAQPFPEAGE